MKKTVYFEGLGLVEGHFSGIGQYIFGILKGIDEIIEIKKLNGDNVPDVKVIIPYDKLEHFKSFEFKNIQPKMFAFSAPPKLTNGLYGWRSTSHPVKKSSLS